MKTYYYKIIDSPVGKLRLVASEQGLSALLWANDRPGRVRLEPQMKDRGNVHIQETECQIREYFSGKRKVFDLSLDFKGTDFQKQVWSALLKIPYGETRSYGEIARELDHPKAVRAVGAANGRNPISIIAPCHRVIGATGKLTGFAGGLETKAYLLNLESTGKSGAQ